MRAIKRATFSPALVVAGLLGGTWAASLSAIALTIPPGGMSLAKSGNDLIVSFPTTGLRFYTVQTCQDLLQPWTNIEPGIPGDGSVKSVTATNAILADKGFYRLLTQTPTKLLLTQSEAFAILGYWCGGIQEKVYVTGFDSISGFPTGDVFLRTSCSTGRAGSPPSIHTAWAAATWDFAGNVISSTTLSNAPTINTNVIAADAYVDTIYNAAGAAYLVVPSPAAPTGVTVAQSGDQFQISWTPVAVNPVAVTSSILTATPLDSTAPVLTTTVAGSATSGIIPTLQPQTTYQITVVSTTIGGSSPASAPIIVATSPATVPPAAPTGVTASWVIPDPTGTTDTLTASWQAADPGNSPIDEYQVTITGSDGGGTFTQTVSGTTLTASFNVDYIPNWSVTVQAHNDFGWGPLSAVITLGGL